MQLDYTWKIVSTDYDTSSMVVEYSHAGTATILNLPIPKKDQQLHEFVNSYAPVEQWKRALEKDDLLQIESNETGAHTVHLTPVNNENPNVDGSWNEEYLRALIYSIIEEINDARV